MSPQPPSSKKSEYLLSEIPKILDGVDTLIKYFALAICINYFIIFTLLFNKGSETYYIIISLFTAVTTLIVWLLTWKKRHTLLSRQQIQKEVIGYCAPAARDCHMPYYSGWRFCSKCGWPIGKVNRRSGLAKVLILLIVIALMTEFMALGVVAYSDKPSHSFMHLEEIWRKIINEIVTHIKIYLPLFWEKLTSIFSS